MESYSICPSVAGLFSLCVTPSKFIHAVTHDISFLFKNGKIFYCTYVAPRLSVPTLTDAGLLHVSATVSKAALKMGVQISVWSLLSDLWGKCPEVESQNYMLSLCLFIYFIIFLRNCYDALLNLNFSFYLNLFYLNVRL